MDNNAQGRVAIDSLLAQTYPDADMLEWTPPPFDAYGQPELLQGIRIYRITAPTPHWLFVTYGMSDVADVRPAEDPAQATSGVGYEFTFRLADQSAATGPMSFERVPPWPVGLLLNMARYVVGSGNPLTAGHALRLNGPIRAEYDTELRVVGFHRDEDLPEQQAVSGRFRFLQLIGMTEGEFRAGEQWDVANVIPELVRRIPKGITDLERTDLMRDEEFADRISAGARTDGSSAQMLHIDHARLTTEEDDIPAIELGATTLRALKPVLPGRIPFGRDLTLGARLTGVLLRPADQNVILEQEDTGTGIVRLTADAATQLADLPIKAGTYDVAGLRVRILASPITDQQGTVLEVVGE